jgi:hypothetical protein
MLTPSTALMHLSGMPASRRERNDSAITKCLDTSTAETSGVDKLLAAMEYTSA